MQYILFITNKFNLLIWKLTLKFSCNRIISRNKSRQDKINNNKNKRFEDKNIKEKSVCNTNIDKIIQIDNIFLTNILMFCDKENKDKSLELLYFKRL